MVVDNSSNEPFLIATNSADDSKPSLLAGDVKLAESRSKPQDQEDKKTSWNPQNDQEQPEEQPEDEQQQQSPEATASILSIWTMSWFDKLLRIGWKQPLQQSDLFPILPSRESSLLADEFDRRWNEQSINDTKKKPSVLGITISMHWKLLLYGLLRVSSDACQASAPLLLQGLIQFLVSSQQSQNAGSVQDPPPAWKGFLYAFGMFALNVYASIVNVNVMQRGVIVGTAIKGQITASIYRKSLRLSGIGRSLFPSGKVLNLVSTDLGRIEQAANQLNNVWTVPFWFLVTVGLLVRVIGPSAFAGIALMVVCVPLQGHMIGRLMRIRTKAAAITDERIKLTSEILQGIRIIKFFTWETNFTTRVSNLRTSELSHIQNGAYIRAIIQSLGFGIPAIASAVTFLVYGAVNPNLSPVQIFAALALFNQLRQPIMWVPVMLATVGDSIVAFRRLQEFFEAPEIVFKSRVDEGAKFGVEVRDGEFVWEGVGDDGDATGDAKKDGVAKNPLSAVDANVGRTIFEKGICGLLSNKTRILVTHQLHFLSRCDWVVLVQDGEVLEQGTFAELMAKEGELSRLMIAYGGEDGGKGSEEGDDEEEVKKSEKGRHRKEIVVEDSSVVRLKSTDGKDKIPVTTATTKKPTFKQIKQETKDSGAIKSSVFIAYVKNYGSTAFVIGTVVALLFTQVTRLSNDIWLVSWTQNSYPWLSRNEYMGVYASLGVTQALALLLYSVLFAIGGIFAAKRLHDQVLTRAVGSPVGFFDQTPLGRIVNRLSRDIDYADNAIYDSLRLFFYSSLQLLATFVLVCYFTKGLFAIVLIPMLAIYYFVQLVYRTSSREVKRIESVSRSPLFAHISESMNGLSTIRAYGEQERFTARTQKLVDVNNSPLYLLYTGQLWIQLRLEAIGNLLVFSVALYAAAERFSINPSQIGLALSYLLQTTALLNMCIFMAAEAEVELNAIERLVEYTTLPIEEEPSPLQPPPQEPPKLWPSNGSISFNNVEMRYNAGLPLVLKGITFQITGGQKIGVVGRTGSGKSSLMQALFRMVTIEGGSIVIDGVDISKIPLKALRSRLAIIPQDPVLFSGSIRDNLDPLELHEDQEIWGVLERCSLKEVVSGLEGKLEAELVENGENISVGQRQLMCLARAVLQKPKIIVLDECTASVDMETDAIIQNTIRTEFADATTLTIAHRLNTIITSDKILYLSNGVTEEFDSPYNLLVENPESNFAKLVGEAGDAMASSLRTFLVERHGSSE
ncbi:hypothetical protein HDU76_001930 [Blyttiomyces sp. JEL0837]|nr:hypothetical protein HDU76_001930 [Blyttiomyces sp. JEL0837]